MTIKNGPTKGTENVIAQLNTMRYLNVYPNMNGIADYWHALSETYDILRKLIRVVTCIVTVVIKLRVVKIASQNIAASAT